MVYLMDRQEQKVLQVADVVADVAAEADPMNPVKKPSQDVDGREEEALLVLMQVLEK